MIDIFKINNKLDITRMICHSGGAEGSDTVFEEEGIKYGIVTKAYSYKTPKHKSKNKVEISEEDYKEGIIEIQKANKILCRFGINRYMSLLSRNWAQVKYSDELFAIGYIVNPGEKGRKGYINKSKQQTIDGGTGYAVSMAINNLKPVYVFDQKEDMWFRWSYTSSSFIRLKKELVITHNNFAGVGTREIKENGINAIIKLYENTFEKS